MNSLRVIFLILGVSFSVGTYFAIKSKSEFIAKAEVVNGKVIELVKSYSSSSSSSRSSSSLSSRRSSSGSKLMYAPVVSFKSKSGSYYRFESSGKSNPPSYSVGETVEVIYDPTNPYDASINGFFSLWFLSIMLGIFAVIFLCIGLFLWIVR